MIFSALVKLAALIVLLMLGGIIVSLIILLAKYSEIWFHFLTQGMGRAKRYLRRAGAHLRHAGDLLYRTADRCSGRFGIALFLTELAPAG